MSKLLTTKNCDKIPPSMHKIKHNSFNIASCGKYGLLRNKSCNCLDSTHAKSNSNSIIRKDGAIACGYICNKCNKTIYKCLSCATIRNTHNNRAASRRHLREHHQTTNENVIAVDGNDIEESSETHLAIEGGFDDTELEKDMKHLNLITYLSNETEIYREFIKHFTKDTVREHLVAMSQDKHFSDVRCDNLCKVDVNLQIN